MLFTANDVWLSISDRASRTRGVEVDPQALARQFNEVLPALVRRVSETDAERLADEVVVPTADVTDNDEYVDITSSSTVEWIHVKSVDWRSSSTGDYADPVVLGTIEQRHQLISEYGHLGWPIGFWFDRMRKIKKWSGWDGVYDLMIYGVLMPTEVDPQDAEGLARVYDYPEPMVRVLKTSLLMRFAPKLQPSELQLALWREEHDSNIAAMLEDADGFVDAEARTEGINHLNFYI